MSQSNTATQDIKAPVKTVTNNKALINAKDIKAPLKGDLLHDTSILLTVFMGEVKNSKIKLDWFKDLTQDNCFSNYKNLTTDIVKTGNSGLIRTYYNYLKNLNTKIKNGSVKLHCLPFGGSFDLKAIDSSKDENNKTKINNIDLNSLSVTEFKKDSVDAMSTLLKEQETIDTKKKETYITHDDSAKASFNAVMGLIANLDPSDRLNVFEQLLSSYNVTLNIKQGEHKKASFETQVKTANKVKQDEPVTKLTK